MFLALRNIELIFGGECIFGIVMIVLYEIPFPFFHSKG
jgi:hypothetical protein